MEKWFIQTKKADFESWSRELGIDVVTARVLRNRDILTAEEARSFLGGSVNEMHDPFLMKDMKKAAEEIIAAVNAGKSIRVIGDYDVDGVTSAYILTKGIKAIGGNVSTAIPHRVKDGYGLNDALVNDAAADGVKLIVTCDNGIAAAAQVELAVSLGMDVIVTDHHEVPFTEEEGKKKMILPKALAVVNPKRYDCEYPFKGICGAMVAYKLMQAVLSLGGNEALKGCMDELLEFAALGTVCDIMELKDENRIAVKEGLKLMSHSSNIGLNALIEVNSLDTSKLSAYHMGFVIGPCINASGRLDTALRAFELLNSGDKAEALTIAAELKSLNDSRKTLTKEGTESAFRYIEEHNLADKSVWIIYLPEVHESIAGIIAGKVRERFNHPVIVLTRGEDGVKGSGRSIEGYHMQESLTAAAHLLDKFGGHAMAAGMSLQEENIEKLDEFLNDHADLKEDDFAAKVMIDVPMPIDYATMKLAKELESLEPFGAGNPIPLFAMKDVELISMKRFGSEGKYARYNVKTPSGKQAELTSFTDPALFLSFLDEKFGEGTGKRFEEAGGFPGNSVDSSAKAADKSDDHAATKAPAPLKINIVYSLDINRFKGRESLQYMLKNFC
ncbi:MAG: single-stranded-DNA-specific exonuclease RecJ [Lachnospiraceae bacterium]|nr:single-stranded-DNA-specific exonuclease RecJ [Lachnospiraceae bacterium]